MLVVLDDATRQMWETNRTESKAKLLPLYEDLSEERVELWFLYPARVNLKLVVALWIAPHRVLDETELLFCSFSGSWSKLSLALRFGTGRPGTPRRACLQREKKRIKNRREGKKCPFDCLLCCSAQASCSRQIWKVLSGSPAPTPPRASSSVHGHQKVPFLSPKKAGVNLQQLKDLQYLLVATVTFDSHVYDSYC